MTVEKRVLKGADMVRTVFENEYLPAAFAPDILEANGRSYEERLASCKMIVSPTDTTPTLVGLLALGKMPQDFLPGAFIQFLRAEFFWNAVDLSNSEDEKTGSNSEYILEKIIITLMAYFNSAGFNDEWELVVDRR